MSALFSSVRQSISNIVVAGSASTIGADAFRDWTGLQNVRIDNGVTIIGDNAFSGCTNLTDIAIPDSLISVGYHAFDNTPFLDNQPDGLVIFNDIAFKMKGACPYSVIIPDAVSSIGDYAFSGCSGLTSVTIPDGVTSIGRYAFQNCRELMSVAIPCSITNIGAYAFSSCRSLAVVEFAGDAPSVGEGAFRWVNVECRGVVSRTSSGWGSPISRTWNDLLICYPWYVVKFDAMGGNCSEAHRTVEHGHSIGELPVPSKMGYIFDGWGLTANDIVLADLKLHAQWTPIKYTVTFDANGGQGGVADKLDYESELVAPSVNRAGYTFLGWSPEVAATVPLGGATYTAQWQINQYDVVFDANGGTGGASTNLDYGMEIVVPSVMRAGYTFVGWSPTVDETVPAHDVTYTAQWTLNKYTVTFDANGGIGGIAGEYDYESELVAPTVAREGYTFLGWSPEVGETVPLGGTTYTAQWAINSYDVVFDANGGEGGTSTNIEYGTAIDMPTVTRAGYTFKCWSPSVDETVPAHDVTYTAQWIPNKYAITFDANGGIGGIAGEYDYESELVAPTVAREGYTFLGWSPEVGETVPLGGTTYTAQWAINSYDVVFDANGGEGGTSAKQDYGTPIVVPTVTRAGYTFLRWSPSVAANVPTSDVTYTAQWKVNQYTMTFHPNGGESEVSMRLDYGSRIVSPQMTRTGYTFKGWIPEVPVTVPTKDMIFVAQWEINQYTVMFDANGGEGGTIARLDYGAPIVAPTVTRTGYTFVGWSPSVAATVPAKDVTYTAQWNVNKYAVTFDANGGDGGATATLDYGAAIVPPTVTRTGYTFNGWSPELAESVPAENVTYTAQWEINKYSVTFDANGGEGGTNYVADYGTPIIIPQVSREGYVFKGWSPEVDQTVPDHDVVYVAQWDRISFSYRIVNGKAIILGSVDSTGESASLSGDVIIPSEIEGYPVMEIASRAFYGCSGLTGVTIPESVTSIGADAFNGCSGLMSMTIPENVTSIADRAFSGCTELTYITMPASVTRLGNAVFSQCRELTDVVLPDNITRIGCSLFSECSGLTNAVIPSKVIYIEEGAFKNCSALECVTIPSSVLSIGGSAFYGCTRLSDIIIPYGVSSIGESAFYGCGELTSMVIPDSVMDIGYFAFKNCTNLASVQLPNKLATIKQELFSGCSALENIVIPDTVIEIGWGAFQDCASVADVIIPNSVTKIGGSAFRGCKSLQGITIPKPTTDIGAYAFAKCEKLSNIEILSELTNIEDGLFSGCGNLTSVKLPNSLSRLGAYAFLSCNRLANINIPEAVKDIGEYAFYQCGNLQHIYFEGDAPVAQASSFINIPASCRLLVKSSSTGWGVAIPGVWNGCHLDYMKEYTVTLNGNYENSDIDSKTLYDNGMVVKIGELPSMTRNGFRFDGWFTEPEGGAKVAPDTIVSGDITVYAHWVKTCVVMFNANGGFFSDDNHQTYGVSATTLECGYGQTIDAPEVIRDKYDFAGWFTSAEGGEMFGEDCVVDTDNLTLYAHWQQRANTWYYDVVYRFEAEATITRYITDNQDVVIPSEFHNDYDMYYGYYEPITVTRIGNRAFEGCFYLESLTIPATVTRIDNYAFPDCFGLRIYFEGNAPSNVRCKLYGFYAYVRHETSGWPTEIPGTWMGASIDWRDQYVAFDANGGEGGVTNLLDRGTEIVAPTVTRTGYKFKGWEPAVASTVPNEDVAYTAQWEPIIVSAPVIATENGCDVFKTDLCRIVISSATEGAAIYYTDDGSTPRLQDEYLYTGPITITETTIFKAVAVLEGVKSAYATLTVTKKELKLEDALDVSDGVSVDTEETFPWKPVLDAEPKEGDSSARSAEIGDRASSWLSTTVSGAGIFSFWCKTSCEHDDDNTFSWDRLMVYTNNVEIAIWRMDGETDWMQRLIEFEGGENTVKWIYYKDRIGADGEDCAWVDSIAWRPLMTDATVEIGGGKYVVVPGEWLSEHQDYLCAKASDIDVALKSTSANGRLSIVECYLLGLDPEKTDDDFKITSFPMKADGSPDLEAITFSPPQSKWNISSAMPKLKGKAKLSDQWQDVPPGGNPSFRFFSIQVELP